MLAKAQERAARKQAERVPLEMPLNADAVPTTASMSVPPDALTPVLEAPEADPPPYRGGGPASSSVSIGYFPRATLGPSYEGIGDRQRGSMSEHSCRPHALSASPPRRVTARLLRLCRERHLMALGCPMRR